MSTTPDLGRCRFCTTPLRESFVDLGMSPISNAYPAQSDVGKPEVFFPLHAFVCHECFLVQLHEVQSPTEIFTEYAYFSSFSDSWLAHCKRFADSMIERFELGPEARVVEIASNDGYLLQYFQERGIPVLGVEPAKNVAATAVAKGIPTLVEFFGSQQAARMVAAGQRADLLVGNNVLAHVPDLNDFVAGLGTVLTADGVLSMEFPHLARLVEGNQFDTIYHEHFSYLSLLTVKRVFASHGLRVFDVEELPTHGGSLRVLACLTAAKHAQTGRVEALQARELADGFGKIETYRSFAAKVIDTKCALLEFLIDARRRGKRVVGYGAPAKGNTLLNFCGARADLIDYTVDRNPYKQGRLLPGTRIPIRAPEEIARTKPDYVLILPWNLRDEIVQSMAQVREWGGQFVVPIPRVEILGVKLVSTEIAGAFLVEVEPMSDERGSFHRQWCARELAAAGLVADVAQISVSVNTRRGTLRGMHYQASPHGETKLVSCVRGAIFDVLVDLRPGPGRLRWVGHELTAANRRMLYVPEGVAHGFLTLEDASEVQYFISTFHEPASARGVRYNDPAFAIRWPGEVEVISARDAAYPDVTS